MDPALVPLQSSDASQVTHHAPNHTWHTGNRFKENYSVNPVSLFHPLRIISCDEIDTIPASFYGTIGKPVFEALNFPVSYFDILDVLEVVDRVGHHMVDRVVDELVFWQFCSEM